LSEKSWEEGMGISRILTDEEIDAEIKDRNESNMKANAKQVAEQLADLQGARRKEIERGGRRETRAMRAEEGVVTRVVLPPAFTILS